MLKCRRFIPGQTGTVEKETKCVKARSCYRRLVQHNMNDNNSSSSSKCWGHKWTSLGAAASKNYHCSSSREVQAGTTRIRNPTTVTKQSWYSLRLLQHWDHRNVSFYRPVRSLYITCVVALPCDGMVPHPKNLQNISSTDCLMNKTGIRKSSRTAGNQK